MRPFTAGKDYHMGKRTTLYQGLYQACATYHLVVGMRSDDNCVIRQRKIGSVPIDQMQYNKTDITYEVFHFFNFVCQQSTVNLPQEIVP